MRCRKCGAESPENAKFCRGCGEVLNVNFIDAHSDYAPATLYSWRNPFKYVKLFFKLLFLLGLFFTVYLAIYEFIDIKYYSNEYNIFKFISMFIVGGVLLIASVFGVNYCRKRILPKDYKLSDVADYVKRYNYFSNRYTFYVKDGKYGLLDVRKFKVHFPAEYDMMEWREFNKLLVVIKGNRQYIIDIFGNELK